MISKVLNPAHACFDIDDLIVSEAHVGKALVINGNSNVGFSQTAVSVTEANTGSTNVTFTVTLDRALAVSQTVDWTLVFDGSNPATAGDFASLVSAGTLTFAANQTSQTIARKRGIEGNSQPKTAARSARATIPRDGTAAASRDTSTDARNATCNGSICTPAGQTAVQASHARQFSSRSIRSSVRGTRPSTRARMRAIRPRGPSLS